MNKDKRVTEIQQRLHEATECSNGVGLGPDKFSQSGLTNIGRVYHHSRDDLQYLINKLESAEAKIEKLNDLMESKAKTIGTGEPGFYGRAAARLSNKLRDSQELVSKRDKQIAELEYRLTLADEGFKVEAVCKDIRE